MFDLTVFLKIFSPVFLVVASVGPCFLTYANISMNYGYKKGFIAAFGCFTVDILYITLGVFAISTLKSFIPEALVIALGIFAGFFLLYLAYSIWSTTEKNLTSENVKNNSIAIYFKLLCLTLSNPLAIIGYASIFSSINNVYENILSIFLGAISAALLAHSLVVVSFATIGKNIKTKVLLLLNKISAIIISIYAVLILKGTIMSIVNKLFQ